MTEKEAPAPSGSAVTKPDRGHLIGVGAMWLAKWSLVLAAIALGALLFGWIIEKLWVIVLPVLLAVVVCTVLWPPTRAMTKRRIPPAAAAATTLVVFIAVVAGIIAGIVPSVVRQAPSWPTRPPRASTRCRTG